MKATGCSYCQKPKQYEEQCVQCNTQVFYCENCYGKKNSTCPSCSSLECIKCKKELASLQKTDYSRTFFKLCKEKKHSVAQCTDCLRKNLESLVSNEDFNDCFLCFVPLKKDGLIYFNEKLNCKENHKIVLCSLCVEIFKKVKTECPLCNNLDPLKQRCIACLKEVKSSLSILPVACFEPTHKFPICLDCTEKISKPNFACRYCCLKDQKYFSLYKIYNDIFDNQSLLGFRVISNKINPQNRAIDPSVCPVCEPITLRPFLINENHKVDIQDSPFLQGASVCQVEDKCLLSGGFDAAETMKSSPFCALIKFNIDGRIKNYSWSQFPPLLRARNSHGSVYYQKENIIYAFGGVSKDSLQNIEYLDSIETNIFNLDEKEKANEWEYSQLKLTKPRAFFSYFLLKDSIYLFGGVSSINTRENTIEKIDLLKKKIEILNIVDHPKLELPIKPALYSPSDDHLIILGGLANNTKSTLVYDLNVKTHSITFNTNKEIQFNSDAKVWVFSAFGLHIAISGKNFGPVKDGKKDGQLRFKVLGNKQGDVAIDAPMHGLKDEGFTGENHFLFDCTPVEFVMLK